MYVVWHPADAIDAAIIRLDEREEVHVQVTLMVNGYRRFATLRADDDVVE